MLERYDAVRVLRGLTVLLLVAAGWFVFRAASASELAQVSPDRCPSGYSLSLSSCTNNSYNLVNPDPSTGNCPSGYLPELGSCIQQPKAAVSKHAYEVFGCQSVWDRWVAKSPYSNGGTSFADLTGSWTPAEKIYDSPYSLASMSCVNSNRGRTHLFWTFIVLAGLALVASEVVRRDLLRE